jgi:hypothetical protein
MLFVDDLPEDQFDSVRDGRGMPGAISALTAPTEFLGLDLILSLPNDTPSGKEATEVRLLLVAEDGVGISVVSGAGGKRVSMNDRKYRFALSLGPASFSVK